MKKEFNFKGDGKGFFGLYIHLLSASKPINGLRRQDKDVLITVMHNNDVLSKDFKDPEDPKKWNALFSYENRLKMIDECHISEAGFANCLTSLRKVNLLDPDNRLHPALRVYPDKSNSIVFNFSLKDDQQGSI